MIENGTIRETLRTFIVSTFLFDSGDVADNASLMGEGVIDSTSVLELVMFIEETFGIKVADDDVLPENFDSIAGLTSYVACKRDLGPAAPQLGSGRSGRVS